MRVCLFTDTLGDVNGVCRFIQDAADRALSSGRELHVLTCTTFRVPDRPTIHNFPPLYSRPMPGYETLQVVVPPVLAMYREALRLRPDVIHLSTPGPVGSVGRLAAWRLGVPILGVYHTDFPAYIDHLFGDPSYTWLCRAVMREFYRPFRAIFTRSDDYQDSLVRLGISRDRLLTLLAGVDIERFHPKHRDMSVWDRLGVPREAVKVLSVGRVSVEKNLPLLVKAWPAARARGLSQGIDARLIVVGDGPYRASMESELNDSPASGGGGAHFLGFRHGQELSSIYAGSDMFVFPSATDTLGQVAMESQASGLPVLVSDRGGPKEVVADGRTGCVLPADRPEAWSEAMGVLIADAGMRARMGAAGHAAMQGRSFRHSFEDFWRAHESAAEGRRR
ncbi:MAG: glycosyltransferase family 4 protein [Phycisphaerales bacterium]